MQAIASEEAPSGLRKQAHSSGTISLAYPIGWKADQETGGISDDVNVITLTVESGKGNPACILVDNPDEPYSSRIADFEASDQVVEKDEFTFNGKAAMRFKRIQKTATGANINTYIDYFFDGDGRQSYQFTCLLVPEIDEATVDTLVHYLQLK
ncbi:hypothetical protein JNJ66_04160 [Candidatus Saccharibacteria bacterium]|nr:hypothetical protein [Candidatus Saccharibacteria bacterium]